MAKTKVFVSFDYDHDETLKEFLVGQSKLKDSPLSQAGGVESNLGICSTMAFLSGRPLP